MSIAVRFLSGSLEGREFKIEKDVARIGDAADADVRVNPEEPENAGARDRVIEVFRDGNVFRIHSIGNREISAQGETAIDRKIDAGEEVRFGAWGPVFVLDVPGSVAAADAPMARTAPIGRAVESTGKNRIREVFVRTESGEKPVGPKTVYMMIQDALGKAQRETDAGVMQRGTIFVREMVSETINNATRSLKIGLALLAAAFIVVAGALAFGLVTTKKSVSDTSAAAQKRVDGVQGELQGLKVEHDKAAVESATLTKRLDEVAKTADGGQKAVADLKARLRDAEQKRAALESKMAKAMTALEADRAALAAEKARVEQEAKDRAAAEERRREDEARKAKEEADRKAQEEARRAAEAQAAPAAPSTTPQSN